ncbi:MAG: hypothetical protein WCI18_14185 [Pseudomonadota bacterium]
MKCRSRLSMSIMYALFVGPAIEAALLSEKAYSSEQTVQPLYAAAKEGTPDEETLKDESIPAEELGSKDSRKKVGAKLKKDILKKIELPPLEIKLFPDWPVQSFDYFISPIVGYAAEKKSIPGGSVSSAIYEGGLGAALVGIPIQATNPGLTVDILGGKVWGGVKNVSSSSANEGGKMDLDATSYQRSYGAVYFTGYYKALKLRLGLKRGQIDYGSQLWQVNNNQSFGVENDIGVLVLSWLSGHYTLSMDRVWLNSFNDPRLVEYDHWLHGKIASSTLKSSFDLGPGFSTSREVEKSGTSALTQSVNYAKAELASNPFWKFSITASAKYILSKSGELELTGLRLPEEGLYDPKEKGLPADSLSANWFVGFQRLLGGMGVGYQVNLTITQMGDRALKTTTRTSGWVVNYTMGL